MPKRQLPNSNAKRSRALKAATDRKSITLPADMPLTAATVTRLDVFFPQYKTKQLAVNTALAAQSLLTGQVKAAKLTAGYFVADMIDALQNAIRRGTFNEGVRSLYSLPVNKPLRPEIITEQDVLDWGERVHDGETARIAAGGTAIGFPTLAEVDAAVNNFRTLNLSQAAAKTTYDNAQEALVEANIEADKLILKIWNELEAAFDVGDKPSVRRKAREWGVVYVPSPGETPSPDDYSIMGTVTDSAAGNPLEDVAVLINGTPVIEVTGADGKYFIPVQTPGTYDITFYKGTYQPKDVSGVVVVAGAITTVNAVLDPAGPTGTVAGNVKQGGMNVAANVSINGIPGNVTTDGMGNFIMTDVPEGPQTVRVELTANPAMFQIQNITVIANSTNNLQFNF